ncbi:MAG: hypothetical protein M1833_004807 [Piccolia ochrophora]|nr:MAG: hypothetical protein M1833_004807 [Piccolia ochrophora]
MICQQCLRQVGVGIKFRKATKPLARVTALSRRSPPPPWSSSQHHLSTTPGVSQETISPSTVAQSKPRQTPSAPFPSGPPSATSTSAAQPFSTPLTPSPGAAGVTTSKPAPTSPTTPPLPVSSAPAGMALKGLNYLKNKADPVAGEETEYPAWLWRCLDNGEGQGKQGTGATDAGDLFAKSKKQRRAAAKRLRKQAATDPDSLVPKVPLQQQTVNLPWNESGTVEGAVQAGEGREELTEAMRKQRRGGIKESNFLKGMK